MLNISIFILFPAHHYILSSLSAFEIQEFFSEWNPFWSGDSYVSTIYHALKIIWLKFYLSLWTSFDLG